MPILSLKQGCILFCYRCQQTLQRHYEDSKARLRQALEEQYSSDLETATQALNELVSNLRSVLCKWDHMVFVHQILHCTLICVLLGRQELSECQQELDETKELYVQVCHQKDIIEDALSQEWNAKLKAQLDKVQSEESLNDMPIRSSLSMKLNFSVCSLQEK